MAYGLKPYQVSQSHEWAAWATSEVYEIDARAPGERFPPRCVRCLNLAMADLIELLRRQFDRPLLDKTALNRGLDFSLDYIAQPPSVPADVAAAIGADDAEPGQPIAAIGIVEPMESDATATRPFRDATLRSHGENRPRPQA